MPFDTAAFAAALRTRRLGRPLHYAAAMASTNPTLLDAAAAGAAAPGTAALAEEQSAGRGRQRRLWHSPPDRNLYFSVLWESRQPAARLPQLAMVAALALREAVAAAFPELEIGLKWPNDLLDAAGRKLSGILCECPPWPSGAARRAVVIGVGLNVNAEAADFPPELAATAGSLRIASGRACSREELLADVFAALERWLERWERSADFRECADEWRRHDLLRGRQVAAMLPGQRRLEGVAEGIADDGVLLLRLADGATAAVSAGDVHLRVAPRA